MPVRKPGITTSSKNFETRDFYYNFDSFIAILQEQPFFFLTQRFNTFNDGNVAILFYDKRQNGPFVVF